MKGLADFDLEAVYEAEIRPLMDRIRAFKSALLATLREEFGQCQRHNQPPWVYLPALLSPAAAFSEDDRAFLRLLMNRCLFNGVNAACLRLYDELVCEELGIKLRVVQPGG